MSVRTRRLAVAGALTATAIAVPVAALASSSDSPPTKPAPSTPVNSAAAASKSAAAASTSAAAGSEFPALASSAGISVSRLQAGLIAAKQAGGNSAAGIAAFAASAGVPDATAQRLVNAVFGTSVDRSLTGPTAVAALASRLGVNATAAQQALQRIGALSDESGVDPASAAFAGIAHDLGVSPARLAAALDAVKHMVAGK